MHCRDEADDEDDAAWTKGATAAAAHKKDEIKFYAGYQVLMQE